MAEPLPIVHQSHTPDGEVPPEETLEKGRLLVMALEPLVAEGVLVAFSGGVDSAFLLWAANRALAQGGAGKVTALTTTSPSTPERDRADALAFTERLGLRHLWRESQEMALHAYARNDRNRCYHCKVELFRIALEVAQEEETKWLLYGFNASDRKDDRPGHRAAQEVGAGS